ncbi:hypothetical protein BESB_014820 [Besnoitia besnoiti]|uniref:Uncharacterized protein n=1 Tax=Besnoitia besnoiti TaxID=94643 RepID=A0A2A9M4J5_BESBE|nr:hypothetical protein BESB_014820 [Besnoitia besnoiti]PFH32869.1 hypothetical protein BESB_014820 [Besnoitia besnoiti]
MAFSYFAEAEGPVAGGRWSRRLPGQDGEDDKRKVKKRTSRGSPSEKSPVVPAGVGEGNFAALRGAAPARRASVLSPSSGGSSPRAAAEAAPAPEAGFGSRGEGRGAGEKGRKAHAKDAARLGSKKAATGSAGASSAGLAEVAASLSPELETKESGVSRARSTDEALKAKKRGDRGRDTREKEGSDGSADGRREGKKAECGSAAAGTKTAKAKRRKGEKKGEKGKENVPKNEGLSQPPSPAPPSLSVPNTSCSPVQPASLLPAEGTCRTTSRLIALLRQKSLSFSSLHSPSSLSSSPASSPLPTALALSRSSPSLSGEEAALQERHREKGNRLLALLKRQGEKNGKGQATFLSSSSVPALHASASFPSVHRASLPLLSSSFHPAPLAHRDSRSAEGFCGERSWRESTPPTRAQARAASGVLAPAFPLPEAFLSPGALPPFRPPTPGGETACVSAPARPCEAPARGNPEGRGTARKGDGAGFQRPKEKTRVLLAAKEPRTKPGVGAFPPFPPAPTFGLSAPGTFALPVFMRPPDPSQVPVPCAFLGAGCGQSAKGDADAAERLRQPSPEKPRRVVCALA